MPWDRRREGRDLAKHSVLQGRISTPQRGLAQEATEAIHGRDGRGPHPGSVGFKSQEGDHYVTTPFWEFLQGKERDFPSLVFPLLKSRNWKRQLEENRLA